MISVSCPRAVKVGSLDQKVVGAHTCGSISEASAAHGNTEFISARNSRLRVRLVTSANPLPAKFLLYPCLTSEQLLAMTYADLP
jgi:hypothetical protein